MYYEINVSVEGRHLFATAERSITTKLEFERIVLLFQKKFPETEGFKLSAAEYSQSGKRIAI